MSMPKQEVLAVAKDIDTTKLPLLATLLNAKRKPKNTSDVRWRIELRRRAAQQTSTQCVWLQAALPDPNTLP